MADSQKLAREFADAGFALSDGSQRPDVFVLNSCTITHVADRKARQAAAATRRKFPGALIVATGCYVDSARAEVEKLTYVDLALPNRDKPLIVSAVMSRLGVSRSATATEGAASFAASPGRTRAFIKIQEGCDQVCAYCIVPKVRGRERSIAPDEIIRQVNQSVERGAQEVVLTGTQLGHYGAETGPGGLADLISRVLVETHIKRIRVSSLQPQEVTEGLLGLWTGQGRGRLCPHFHLPLQSGSDTILHRMRRRYKSADFINIVGSVRRAVPGCSITTDVIVGFPGESEDDHAATREMIDRVKFAAVHVFPYSVRPGTSAAHFTQRVPDTVKKDRAADLRHIAASQTRRFMHDALGDVRPVLWEIWRDGAGLTDNYLKVIRKPLSGNQADTAWKGTIEDVLLTGIFGDSLTGQPAAKIAVPAP